jgi:hypothetical protein
MPIVAPLVADRLITAGFDIAEAPDVPTQVRHASGKSDTIDAAEIARAARGLTTTQLRRPARAGTGPSCES